MLCFEHPIQYLESILHNQGFLKWPQNHTNFSLALQNTKEIDKCFLEIWSVSFNFLIITNFPCNLFVENFLSFLNKDPGIVKSPQNSWFPLMSSWNVELLCQLRFESLFIIDFWLVMVTLHFGNANNFDLFEPWYFVILDGQNVRFQVTERSISRKPACRFFFSLGYGRKICTWSPFTC